MWHFPKELCAMNISQGNGFRCLNKVNGEFVSVLPFNRKFSLWQNYILWAKVYFLILVSLFLGGWRGGAWISSAKHLSSEIFWWMSLTKAPPTRSRLVALLACSPSNTELCSKALPSRMAHELIQESGAVWEMQSQEQEEVIFQIVSSELAPVVPDRTSSWTPHALKVILDIWLLVTTVRSVPTLRMPSCKCFCYGFVCLCSIKPHI